MLTIFPGALRAMRARPTNCDNWKTELRLTCMTFCQSSKG